MNVQRKYILTVTLNPAIDKIFKVRHFSSGKNFIYDEAVFSAGGKGINVARVLNQFGLKSIATGFIGGLSGECIRQYLREEEITFDFVPLQGETRTNTTIIDSQTNEITRILEEGPWGKS